MTPGSTLIACATPTAGACRMRSKTAVKAALAAVNVPDRNSLPQRFRSRRRQYARRCARGRGASAGNHQRLRRAMRQRQPGFDHREFAAQARLQLRAARQAQDPARNLDAGLRAGQYHAESRARPYVGRSAFAHKGGLHVSGIQRNVHTYEHIDPALLGNDRRVLLSELSGRANIVYKAKEFGIESERRATTRSAACSTNSSGSKARAIPSTARTLRSSC